jgi:hypothetical protein
MAFVHYIISHVFLASLTSFLIVDNFSRMCQMWMNLSALCQFHVIPFKWVWKIKQTEKKMSWMGISGTCKTTHYVDEKYCFNIKNFFHIAFLFRDFFMIALSTRNYRRKIHITCLLQSLYNYWHSLRNEKDARWASIEQIMFTVEWWMDFEMKYCAWVWRVQKII